MISTEKFLSLYQRRKFLTTEESASALKWVFQWAPYSELHRVLIQAASPEAVLKHLKEDFSKVEISSVFGGDMVDASHLFVLDVLKKTRSHAWENEDRQFLETNGFLGNRFLSFPEISSTVLLAMMEQGIPVSEKEIESAFRNENDNSSSSLSMANAHGRSTILRLMELGVSWDIVSRHATRYSGNVEFGMLFHQAMEGTFGDPKLFLLKIAQDSAYRDMPDFMRSSVFLHVAIKEGWMDHPEWKTLYAEAKQYTMEMDAKSIANIPNRGRNGMEGFFLGILHFPAITNEDEQWKHQAIKKFVDVGLECIEKNDYRAGLHAIRVVHSNAPEYASRMLDFMAQHFREREDDWSISVTHGPQVSQAIAFVFELLHRFPERFEKNDIGVFKTLLINHSEHLQHVRPAGHPDFLDFNLDLLNVVLEVIDQRQNQLPKTSSLPEKPFLCKESDLSDFVPTLLSQHPEQRGELSAILALPLTKNTIPGRWVHVLDRTLMDEDMLSQFKTKTKVVFESKDTASLLSKAIERWEIPSDKAGVLALIRDFHGDRKEAIPVDLKKSMMSSMPTDGISRSRDLDIDSSCFPV